MDFERNTSKHVSSRALWNSRPRCEPAMQLAACPDVQAATIVITAFLHVLLPDILDAPLQRVDGKCYESSKIPYDIRSKTK